MGCKNNWGTLHLVNIYWWRWSSDMNAVSTTVSIGFHEGGWSKLSWRSGECLLNIWWKIRSEKKEQFYLCGFHRIEWNIVGYLYIYNIHEIYCNQPTLWYLGVSQQRDDQPWWMAAESLVNDVIYICAWWVHRAADGNTWVMTDVPIFHITQPWMVYGLLDGYY